MIGFGNIDKFSATAGPKEAFGATPQEALDALMQILPDDAFVPIILQAYSQDDALSPDAQDANNANQTTRAKPARLQDEH